MTPEQMRRLAALLGALADAGLEVSDSIFTREITIYVVGADELRETARAVKAAAGPLRKRQGRHGLELIAGIPDDVSVRIVVVGGVCERVQVGTRTVTKPDPAAPLVEVEEPVYEVRCPDSVLADLEPEAVTA